ncbi:MAG: hypothetical protein P8R42_01595 [Candidatus Binatia bacterium]|nr:hypothetical protein [Candidatus Binatia bacterium]
MKPSPKSFILDLLSTLKHGTMPVSALVEAGELFGIGANNMRVALARLLAAGQVGRDERGRYRLGDGTRPVAKRLAGWRDPGHRTRQWDGSWIGVHCATADPKIGRSEKRGRKRALHLLGFELLLPNLAVRPSNLRATTAELRAELRSIGLPLVDLVCELRDLDAEQDAAARSLWNTESLRALYGDLDDELRESTTHIAAAPPREAMVESFLVGGRALRELILDPLLPDEICPPTERRALLASMKDYDRLGRAAWAEFLNGYDVPHLRGPIDSRMAVTTGPRTGFNGTDPAGKEGIRP